MFRTQFLPFALLLCTTATRAASPGPVALYSFDEGTGGTAADASGGGITGTVRNATWTAAGKFGGALSFDGATSYVDLGAPAALQITGSMTLEAWVYIASYPVDDGQIIALSTNDAGWQLKTTPDSGVRTFGIAVSPGGSPHAQRYGKIVPALRQWYHVAGVYDASAGTLDLYVNGALDNGVLSGTVPASQTLPAGVSANIGRRAGGYYFDGVIDEVRIYDRALTQAEIQNDMNTPVGWGGAAKQASYAFSEGSGATTADSWGGRNTGTLQNAAWTASGRYGCALSFDGTSSYVDLGAPSALQITGSMTLEAWVYIAGNPPDDGQIVAFSNDAAGWQLKSTPDAGGRTFGIAVSRGGSPHTQRYGATVPALYHWYHVAGVYDAAAQTLDLYVNGALDNGVLKGTVPASQTIPAGLSANIGRRSGGYYFNGIIDEVRIYGRALTQAEIQADMNTPLDGGAASPPPSSPDTQPPDVPGNLTATPGSSTRIDLAWTASSDNVAVAGYRVFRDASAVGTTTSASYADTGLSPATAYAYTVAAFDAAGNTSPASQPAFATTASPIVQGASGYPVRVSENGRYLVDGGNAPFLIHGDSPQTLIGKLSTKDAARYFADRQALGFNTVWINLLCNSYNGCNSDGTTYDGIAPFTTAGDLATPNEAYFQRADAMINLAAQYGILVILDPIETGGWLPVLRANGATRSFNYGVFLGNRYRNFPNILWMSGNDFQTWTTASDDAVAQAVALGIKSADPNHIHTVELDYLTSSSLNDAAWGSIISLNAAYTYYPTYAEVLHAYNQSSSTPVFMVEANYESEQNYTDYGSPAVLRRQEYWSALSGAAGQLYSSHDSYFLGPGALGKLDTPGAIQFGYLKNLLSAQPWYDLVPDQDHTTVTAGYGTFSPGGTISADDYLTAARTPSGSLAMAYMPSARTITVDMTRLSGPANARWFDPSNGTYIAIAGSPLANSGSMQFTPPGANSTGDSDWALVLEATPATGRRSFWWGSPGPGRRIRYSTGAAIFAKYNDTARSMLARVIRTVRPSYSLMAFTRR